MIRARRVAFGVTDSAFIMGSMGAVVGEKLTRLIERATADHLPLIIISASGGGARMHEGILSLMQMAKVSAALARYDRAGGLFISVLTNPTMGGVAASFASLGDVMFAEPKALIGFAGPRTIQATIRIELPKGFQTSEFLLEHGYIDRIVRRAGSEERNRPHDRLLRQIGGSRRSAAPARSLRLSQRLPVPPLRLATHCRERLRHRHLISSAARTPWWRLRPLEHPTVRNRLRAFVDGPSG